MKRYDFYTTTRGDGSGIMEEYARGNYIRYSDHLEEMNKFGDDRAKDNSAWLRAKIALEAERDALRERCGKLEKALEEILRGVNADPRSVVIARAALAATEEK